MNSIDAHSVLATRAASDVSVTRAPSGTATGPKPEAVSAAEGIAAVKRASEQVVRVSDSLASQKTRASEEIQAVQAKLDEIVSHLNVKMEVRDKSLNFSVDEVSNRVMVTVTDKVSGEVVRQVPSEAILKVAHNIEALKGVLFDKNI
jgi:flagellar protein FlaG